MRDWFNDKVIESRKNGWTYREIAKHNALTVGQVAGILHRAGMTKDPMKRNHARKDRIAADKLKGASLEAISVETGIPASTLKDWRLGR